MDSKELILTVKNEINSYFLTPYNEKIEYFTFKKIEKDSPFKNIFELEIERIKFLIGKYLKARIVKIRENRQINIAFLSQNELQFYEKIKNFIKSEGKKRQAVAFVALENIGRVLINGKDIYVRENDLYICFFDEIETYVYENKIQLL